MHYPQIILYKKILYGLLALHLLIGAVMLYGALLYSEQTVIGVTIGILISIFYLVLLITLINYVEYLDKRLGVMLDRFIRLENDLNPDKRPTSTHADSLSQSRSSLSDRLGKL